MAKREKRERERWDRPLERIGFHGVTQEEVSGGAGLSGDWPEGARGGRWNARWTRVWGARDTARRASTAGTAATGVPKRPRSP
ncbi:MAG: hypothetical protein LBH85_00655, partial [Treponema sp.]|nr:hypothetical protein [Treponema sp.]